MTLMPTLLDKYWARQRGSQQQQSYHQKMSRLVVAAVPPSRMSMNISPPPCKWVEVEIISQKVNAKYCTRWCPDCTLQYTLREIISFIEYDSTMVRYSGGISLRGMDMDILGTVYKENEEGASALLKVVRTRGVTRQKVRLQMLHKTDNVSLFYTSRFM
jgi:hypothetical protein